VGKSPISFSDIDAIRDHVKKDMIIGVVAGVCWSIWKTRNEWVFSNKLVKNPKFMNQRSSCSAPGVTRSAAAEIPLASSTRSRAMGRLLASDPRAPASPPFPGAPWHDRCLARDLARALLAACSAPMALPSRARRAHTHCAHVAHAHPRQWRVYF
jgi:hypothetical protein